MKSKSMFVTTTPTTTVSTMMTMLVVVTFMMALALVSNPATAMAVGIHDEDEMNDEADNSDSQNSAPPPQQQQQYATTTKTVCPKFDPTTLGGKSWPFHTRCNLEQHTSYTIPLFRSTNPNTGRDPKSATGNVSHHVLIGDTSPLKSISDFGAAHWGDDGTWVPLTELQPKIDSLAVHRSEMSLSERDDGSGKKQRRGHHPHHTTTSPLSSRHHLSTQIKPFDAYVKTWGVAVGSLAFFGAHVRLAAYIPVFLFTETAHACTSIAQWFRTGGYKVFYNIPFIKKTIHNALTWISDTILSLIGVGRTAISSHWLGSLIRGFNAYVRPARLLQSFSVVVVKVEYPTDWGKTNAPGRKGGMGESSAALLSSGSRSGLSARIFVASPMRMVTTTTPLQQQQHQGGSPGSSNHYVGVNGGEQSDVDVGSQRHRALFGDGHHQMPLTCEPWSMYTGPHLFEHRKALRGISLNKNLEEDPLSHHDDDVEIDDSTEAFYAERVGVRSELLGFHQEVCAPPARGSIPQWLKRLVRPSIHHTLTVTQESALALAKKHTSSLYNKVPTLPPPVSKNISCEIFLPYNTLGCLRVESIFPNRPVMDLSVDVSSAWDIRWLSLAASLLVLTVVKPHLLSNQPLQALATAFLGIGFVAVLLLYLAYSELRKSRIGTAGIFAMFTTGGALGYSETAWTILWSYLSEEIYTNVYLQIGVIGCAVTSFILSRYVFYDKVPFIAASTLTLAQVFLLFTMATHNRDATFLTAPIFISIYFPWVLNLLAVPIIVIVALTKFAYQVSFFPFSVLCSILSSTPSPHPFDNIPRENFSPDELLPRAYVRPIAAHAIHGNTAVEKFQAYNQQGSDATRRALDELAAHIRGNPEKYVSRMRDPGGIARFAGVGHEEEDDE